MPSKDEDATSIVHESPIACESCRQKKCKCDRRLPHCSQCSVGPSRCVYPEGGKRGLPLGYLNQLEQRLADTESALYGALATLRRMQPSTVIQASAKPDSAPKSARMSEWSRLPLRNWSDMERWLVAVADHFTLEQSPQATQVGSSNSDNVRVILHATDTGQLRNTFGEVTEPTSLEYMSQTQDEALGASLEPTHMPIEIESPNRYHHASGVMAGRLPTSPPTSDHARSMLAADQVSRATHDVTRQFTRAEELSKSSSLYF